MGFFWNLSWLVTTFATHCVAFTVLFYTVHSSVQEWVGVSRVSRKVTTHSESTQSRFLSGVDSKWFNLSPFKYQIGTNGSEIVCFWCNSCKLVKSKLNLALDYAILLCKPNICKIVLFYHGSQDCHFTKNRSRVKIRVSRVDFQRLTLNASAQ